MRAGLLHVLMPVQLTTSTWMLVLIDPIALVSVVYTHDRACRCGSCYVPPRVPWYNPLVCAACTWHTHCSQYTVSPSHFVCSLPCRIAVHAVFTCPLPTTRLTSIGAMMGVERYKLCNRCPNRICKQGCSIIRYPKSYREMKSMKVSSDLCFQSTNILPFFFVNRLELP